MQAKPTILLLSDWFAPGYKAGGPIRSCVNFAHTMSSEYQIYVVSTNMDLGASEPYELKANEWLDFSEGVKVWYFSLEALSYQALKKIIHSLNPDFIYINSMFSVPFTIWPLWMKWRQQIAPKMILAPRGMLRKSALQFKWLKKKVYLQVLKWLNIHRLIHFQATDEKEELDILDQFGTHATIHIASHLPTNKPGSPSKQYKKRGELKLVYIARIHPVKNLAFFLEALENQSLPLIFDIYGPMEDRAYWQLCQEKIKGLSDEVEIHYKGELTHEEVADVLKQYHFMVLPTQGENFGHSIFEALSLGVPVMISDQTIWKKLYQQQLGWELPIDEPRGFRKAVSEAWNMEQDTYANWQKACLTFAKNYVREAGILKKYRQLFR